VRTEPTSKKWKNRGKNRKNKEKTDMLRSIAVNSPGNPWSQSWRRNGRLQWEGLAEKEGFTPGMKNEGVMDDESGESYSSRKVVDKTSSVVFS